MTQVFAYFANEDLQQVDFGGGLYGITNWEMVAEGFPVVAIAETSHFYGSAIMLAGLLLCAAFPPLIWGTWHLRGKSVGIKGESQKHELAQPGADEIQAALKDETESDSDGIKAESGGEDDT